MMTPADARLVRLAARLGRQLVVDEDAGHDTHETTVDAFVRTYHPERPCRYAISCLRTGQCPYDPCCHH